MTPDELFAWAREHPDFDRWRDFYHDAFTFACDIAAGSPFNTCHVCWAIAALSPMTGWTRNMDLARDAVALASRVENPLDYAQVREALEPLGTMGARKDSTARALALYERPTGPKVSAFAANLAGDLVLVTVDRHMLDLFEGDRHGCIAYCEYVSPRSGLWPAEVQAVLWGAHRATKGYTTY